MKKIFLILILTLLTVIRISGQATVDIPLMVHDNAGEGFQINFGLDLTATDGIDPWLGEGYYVPIPMPFDTYWSLPPFNGVLRSFKDYRPPGTPPAFPYTGNKQYSIKFQSPDYPITIIWDLPPEIASTSTIQDILGGGIINKVFAGADSLIVTDPSIGQLHVFVDYDNIIPVELTSFTASVLQNEKAVQLNWTTATEINNSGFEILRFAQNDNEWETIGFVPGFGTTTETKSYSFIDENINSGTYKYRLKQIDYDGNFEYSNEIEIIVDFTPKEFVLYQNYPNPFNPTTTIKFEIPSVIASEAKQSLMVSLKVYDILGNEVATLVNEEKQPGVYEVEYNSENLSSGIYFYQLKAGEFTSIKKMVLLR
jgi:hypothetical protein